MSICYCGAASGYPHDPNCPFPYYGDDSEMALRWQRDRNAKIAASLPTDADLAALRAENQRLREALQIYADANNWSTSAHDERETGEFPNEDGYSPTVEVEFETGIPVVWDYNDDGASVARAALA